MMTATEHALIWMELREFFDHEQARAWLETPRAALTYRKPKDCTFAEAMALIDQLKSAAFV
jgi:hypothetical protein